MKKKRAIWLFAGGPMQESAARKILSLDYKLILTDLDRDCICAKYADEFVECDTFDLEGNKKAAERLREKYIIAAGLTLAADCHETVAHVNRQLGLPGLSPEVSHVCRYKNLTRAILTDAGIRQPKLACVKTFDRAKAFLEVLGGKGVIKATNNSGSRGFAKLDSPTGLTEEIFETAILAGTSGSVIVEEALTPREDCIAELSIETLWYNGAMHWLNWVDRLFRSDLHFFPSLMEQRGGTLNWGVEIGHINPARHTVQVRQQIYDLVYSSGLAIGMHKEAGGHVLKADIMLTKSGPVIIELTPRLSGGWDSSATTPMRSADFQGGVIRLALGEHLDLALWHSCFEIKAPSLYASVLADIPSGALDCIGRKFSIGIDFEREKSLQLALNNLKENSYVLPMV